MIIELIRKITGILGIGLSRSRKLNQLKLLEKDVPELLELLRGLQIFEGNSKSQLYQDIFVLLATNFKRDGYFVEFGATNGIDLSNTYLLEKSYGWNGILAEPAKVWHDALSKNRSANIDFLYVWKVSKEIVDFDMAESAELSTSLELSNRGHGRKSSDIYDIETITLVDLLDKYNAPKKIDFLSIDTEGSEFLILNSFDFNKYDISIIACEHDYEFTNDREKIFKLLTDNGYTRKFTGFSKWDDWYFKI